MHIYRGRWPKTLAFRNLGFEHLELFLEISEFPPRIFVLLFPIVPPDYEVLVLLNQSLLGKRSAVFIALVICLTLFIFILGRRLVFKVTRSYGVVPWMTGKSVRNIGKW